jgi:hypothetical protein
MLLRLGKMRNNEKIFFSASPRSKDFVLKASFRLELLYGRAHQGIFSRPTSCLSEGNFCQPEENTLMWPKQ